MMPLIFVYGTLKRGYGLNRMLEGCELVQPNAVLDRELRMVDNGSFPYLLPMAKGKPSHKPTGEVYRVEDAELLADLDRVEGAYDRTKAKTVCGLNVEFYLAKTRDSHGERWDRMPNRYVKIDEAAGTATWGRTPFTGGEVRIHGQYGEPGNELTLCAGSDEYALDGDPQPAGLTDAQKLTAAAISMGHFEIRIGLDGVANITVKPTEDDREYVFGEGGDGDGPQDVQEGD